MRFIPEKNGQRRGHSRQTLALTTALSVVVLSIASAGSLVVVQPALAEEISDATVSVVEDSSDSAVQGSAADSVESDVVEETSETIQPDEALGTSLLSELPHDDLTEASSVGLDHEADSPDDSLSRTKRQGAADKVINVKKVVVGTPPPVGSYVVTVTCLYPPGPPQPTQPDLTLDPNGTIVSTLPVPITSSCTFTETVPPGSPVSYVPINPVTVTSNFGTPGVADVTITNTYPTVTTTTVTLKKESYTLVNPPPTFPASYVVTLTCTPPGGPAGTPVPYTLYTNGATVQVPNILIGSTCKVDEPDTQGTRPIVSTVPAQVAPWQGFTVNTNPTAVTITNFITMSVFVGKQVVDLFPGSVRPTNYNVKLTCTAPPSHPPIPPFFLTLGAGAPATEVPNIWVGSVCFVEELDSQGATVTYTPAQTFTVVLAPTGKDGGRVTVVNTFTTPPPVTPTGPEPPVTPAGSSVEHLATAGFGNAGMVPVGLLISAAGLVVLTITRRRRV